LPGRAGAWVSRAPHQATPGWDGKPAGRFSLSVHPGILNGDAGSTAAIRIGGIPGAVWSLAVYRLDGRRARVLETADAGNAGTTVFWDGCDQENRRLPPGVYLIRLDALDPSGGNRASLVRPLVLGGIP
jgi:hypothetical protein